MICSVIECVGFGAQPEITVHYFNKNCGFGLVIFGRSAPVGVAPGVHVVLVSRHTLIGGVSLFVLLLLGFDG